jgi:hypothetical protein
MGAAGWAKAKLDENVKPVCIEPGCGMEWVEGDFLVLDEELLRR